MVTRVVDYSPLLATPTPHEVGEYRARARAAGEPWAKLTTSAILAYVAVGIFAAIVAVPTIIGLIGQILAGLTSGDSTIGFPMVVFGLGIVGVIITVIVVAVSNSSKWGRWLKLDRFARANGLLFSPVTTNPTYPGSIFRLGNARQSIEHFRSADGRFLDFGNYQYSTGSGKNRRTRTWGFLALHLDRRLPHMVLDSKANNGLFGGSNLPATFAKDQVLSLEGDFDRYFTLYCPREYERDALYVFTPDLMALLIDEAAPYDVEIVDDWMFVYSTKPFTSGTPAVYQRLLRIVDTVGAKALTQTDRYQDERSGAPFASNIVAPGGTRLRRTMSVGAILMTVFAAAIWAWSLFAR